MVKSFSVWVRKDEAAKLEDLPLECHINLWHPRKESPFIDIGLMIPLVQDFNEVLFALPFSIDRNNGGKIKDLYEEFAIKGIPALIFNTDCTYETKYKQGNDSLAVLTINNESPKKIMLVPAKSDSNYGVDIDEAEGIVRIDVSKIREKSGHDQYNNAYMRFRVLSNNIKAELFCDTKKKNWFLESAFTRTQIIDLKINEIRNIDVSLNTKLLNDGWFLAKLSKVHFFIMEPAENQIIYGGNDADCRYLEKEWEAYLKDIYEGADNLLAYHWKKKPKELVDSYSKLVTISSSETRWSVIIVYIIVVILLSAAGSCLYDKIIGALNCVH